MEFASDVRVIKYNEHNRVVQARDGLTVANVVAQRTARSKRIETETHTAEVDMFAGALHLKLIGGHGTLIVRLHRHVLDQIVELERQSHAPTVPVTVGGRETTKCMECGYVAGITEHDHAPGCKYA